MALVTSPDGKKTGPVRGAHLGWTLNLYATETRRGAKGNNVTVKKTILEGVTGSVRSGNMMALMGASGALFTIRQLKAERQGKGGSVGARSHDQRIRSSVSSLLHVSSS
jgi:hypothetical protein